VKLLLLGGGHSHLEIVRRLILEPGRPFETTLVSAGPAHHYSGMVPGYLMGTYTEQEICFDLAALLRRAGGQFVEGTVVAFDPRQRSATLSGGEILTYDLASLAIGSVTRGGAAVSGSVQLVKPIFRATRLRERLLAVAALPHARVVVVGAGAAGFEIACAARSILDASSRTGEVTLVDGASEVLSGYASPVQELARRVLQERQIGLQLGGRVRQVDPDAVDLESGLTLASHLTIWVTGAEAPPLIRQSGLATSDDGFLLVDGGLRSVSHPEVFGAGDCVTLKGHPETPKAGVYATRHGPVLWKSLRAVALGGPPPMYRPQHGFLSLLNTGDGRAILRYRFLHGWSRGAMRLKDAIDRRFMRRYQRLVA